MKSAGLLLLVAFGQQEPAEERGIHPELADPFPVRAEEQPIDVDQGHAAPLFRDFDGDGLADLLVGQFGGGLLAVHVNLGRTGEPRFGEPVWFEAGGATGRIPSG